MSSTVQIGPLVLPLAYLATLAALMLGGMVAHGVARRSGFDPSRQVWRMGAVAVMAARLGFVWRYRSAYLDAPLDILNIRDGGWDAQLGVIAAWAYTLVVVQRHRSWRRSLLTGLAAATTLWLMATVVLLKMPTARPGLPPLVLQELSQHEVALASFRGKPVVLNLWATWCPPCQREMPVLQRAQQTQPDVHYVFVNQGETPEQVRAFLAGHGLQLDHVLLDPKGRVAAAFDAAAYPTTLFFDAQGHLVAQRMGELSWATLMDKVVHIRSAPERQGAR